MSHRVVPLVLLAAALVGAFGSASIKEPRWELAGGIGAPVLTCLFVLAWAAATLLALRGPRRARIELGGAARAWLWFLAWCAATMVIGGVTGEGLFYLAAGGALPVGAVAIATRTRIDVRTTEVWVGCLALVAALALARPAGLRVLPANINLGAMVLLPGFVLGLYLAVVRASALGATAVTVVIAVLLAAGRRSALGACVIAVVLAIASSRRARRPLVVLVVVAVVASSLAVIEVVEPSFAGEVHARVEATLGAYDVAADGSDLRRAILTDQALDVIAEHGVFGVGHGRYLEHLRSSGVDPYYVARPHNIALATLAETGIVGATLLGVALLRPAIAAWRATAGDPLGRYWCIAYVATCVFLLGNDYVHSPGFWPTVAAMMARALATPIDADRRRA